jgi:hypothetical protein
MQQCAPGHTLAGAAALEHPKLRSRQSEHVVGPVSCRGCPLRVHQIRYCVVAAIYKDLHPKLKCQKLPDLHGPVLYRTAVLINFTVSAINNLPTPHIQ